MMIDKDYVNPPLEWFDEYSEEFEYSMRFKTKKKESFPFTKIINNHQLL